MGFGSGGEWRRGPWQEYTWAFQVRRKAFFLSVLKATLGSGKGGFGSRVDSHCYGVWEWRRVALEALAGVYARLSASAYCFFMFFFLSVVKATLGSGKRGFGIRVGIWSSAYSLFFLSGLKATLGNGKNGFGSRVGSHRHGVAVWGWCEEATLASFGMSRRALEECCVWFGFVRRFWLIAPSHRTVDIDGGTRDQPHSHFAREIVSRTGFDGLLFQCQRCCGPSPSRRGTYTHGLSLGAGWQHWSSAALQDGWVRLHGCVAWWCVLVTGLEALRCD